MFILKQKKIYDNSLKDILNADELKTNIITDDLLKDNSYTCSDNSSNDIWENESKTKTRNERILGSINVVDDWLSWEKIWINYNSEFQTEWFPLIVVLNVHQSCPSNELVLSNSIQPQDDRSTKYWLTKLKKLRFIFSKSLSQCLTEAGVTFDNSFFNNYFDFVRQLKNGSFLGPVFVHVTKFS